MIETAHKNKLRVLLLRQEDLLSLDDQTRQKLFDHSLCDIEFTPRNTSRIHKQDGGPATVPEKSISHRDAILELENQISKDLEFRNNSSVDINYGDVICDMHEGLNLQKLGNCRVVKSFRVEISNGTEFINSVVTHQTGEHYNYLNKLLVVIGESDAGNLRLAYSYNSLFIELIEVEQL